MAFTRQNTGTSSTFSRDGVLSTVNIPAFTTFTASKTSTDYSLGNNWSIKISTVNQTLDFNYGVNSVLQLSSSGFSLSSVILQEQTTLPSSPANGTLSHVNNELYIYT